MSIGSRRLVKPMDALYLNRSLWGHSPIRAIAYAKEPDFLNKGCQIKSTDTGFRRCLFSLRGSGTNRLFALTPWSGFFYSQYAGHGRDLSTEALTSLEVGQFASRLDALLLNVHYRTNRRVTPFCLNFPASQLPSPAAGRPFSGWFPPATGTLLRGRRRTASPLRLTFHSGPENPIDACLIAAPGSSQPSQHIRIEPNGELLFWGRPGNRSLFQKLFSERRNVRIVDVGILHPVKPSQVAFDRFFAHGGLPFSWR